MCFAGLKKFKGAVFIELLCALLLVGVCVILSSWASGQGLRYSYLASQKTDVLLLDQKKN